jgi:hypothetical protein
MKGKATARAQLSRLMIDTPRSFSPDSDLTYYDLSPLKATP